MKHITALALGFVLCAPLALLGDEKKPEDKKDDLAAKFVGAWEVTKATEESLMGATVTFAKDNKLSIKVKAGEQEIDIEGTWKIEKGKLITEVNSMSDTDEIKKISDDGIELENKEGKVVVLKKKKADK